MGKYWFYYKIALQEAFVYRARGLIWFFCDIGPSVILILFWLAAYQTNTKIAGFSLTQMLIYYLGVMVINTITVPHPEYWLAEQIRLGEFSQLLLKPIKLSLTRLNMELAWKTIRLLFTVPALFIIYNVFSSIIDPIPFTLANLLFLCCSLILAFLTQLFLKISMGLSTIWFGESGWLFLSFEVITTFLSGELIPLDLLPQSIITLNQFLPFKYFVYFPLSILLGKTTSLLMIINGLFIQLLWLVFFIILYWFIFRRGVKTYAAFGG